MGELGLPSLIKLLDHPNAATRAAAVAYIGVIWENSGDNAAPRAILRSLKDSNSGVKLSAIRALPLPRGTRYEGDQIVVESLIKMIMDNEREVRIAAIQALTHIGDPRAIAPLIALLDDHDKSVRINARFALTDFGEAAMAQLIAAIKSEDKTLRGNAMDALAAFHNEPAVWTLAEFAVHGDTAEVRQMAVATLKRKGAFAINILTPKLNAPDANVRETAKQALAKIKLQK
jgi:HEAT repeat protein